MDRKLRERCSFRVYTSENAWHCWASVSKIQQGGTHTRHIHVVYNIPVISIHDTQKVQDRLDSLWPIFMMTSIDFGESSERDVALHAQNKSWRTD